MITDSHLELLTHLVAELVHVVGGDGKVAKALPQVIGVDAIVVGQPAKSGLGGMVWCGAVLGGVGTGGAVHVHQVTPSTHSCCRHSLQRKLLVVRAKAKVKHYVVSNKPPNYATNNSLQCKLLVLRAKAKENGV